MYDLLKEFIKPELLVLIPVLYLIGMWLKASSVPDNRIPYILGGAGIVLCGMYIVATSEMLDTHGAILALFTAIVQGILISGASVYCNQLIKQSTKADEITDNKTDNSQQTDNTQK